VSKRNSGSRLVRRGTCHVLGDNVPLDDGVIPRRFAAGRVTDPQLLVPHLFEVLDPGFAARVKPGDILLAGSDFACGKPRLQGFIAMEALDLAIICVSMSYKMIRRAVARAIPVIVGATDSQAIATTGDDIEVDFATGTLWNRSRDSHVAFPPMPTILCDIVASGGMQAALKDWLVQHPEQALPPA
jgi:3-isopropylmalate/(R)-2-methylmalate dehydratase small subunit